MDDLEGDLKQFTVPGSTHTGDGREREAALKYYTMISIVSVMVGQRSNSGRGKNPSTWLLGVSRAAETDQGGGNGSTVRLGGGCSDVEARRDGKIRTTVGWQHGKRWSVNIGPP